jgi:hypothetical protein
MVNNFEIYTQIVVRIGVWMGRGLGSSNPQAPDFRGRSTVHRGTTYTATIVILRRAVHRPVGGDSGFRERRLGS